MKFVLLLLIMPFLLFAQSKKDSIRVFYLGGQSNMEGFGYVNELPDSLKKKNKNVFIYQGNPTADNDKSGGLGKWDLLQAGHGTGFSSDGKSNTLSDRFGESSDLAEGFKNDNPLAGSDNYEVYMTDVASQKKLVSFAESLDGVRKVNKSDTVANTLNSVNKLVWYVSVVIIAILLAVSIFLISNTVTMGITVRREEIAIMKYIGAKDGFVRAPFIIEGILIGLVGAAIPLGILYVLYNRAITYILTKFSLLNNILDFLPVGQVYKTLLPVGLLLGIGIGFVGSFFTIRKHLRV